MSSTDSINTPSISLSQSLNQLRPFILLFLLALFTVPFLFNMHAPTGYRATSNMLVFDHVSPANMTASDWRQWAITALPSPILIWIGAILGGFAIVQHSRTKIWSTKMLTLGLLFAALPCISHFLFGICIDPVACYFSHAFRGAFIN